MSAKWASVVGEKTGPASLIASVPMRIQNICSINSNPARDSNWVLSQPQDVSFFCHLGRSALAAFQVVGTYVTLDSSALNALLKDLVSATLCLATEVRQTGAVDPGPW